MAKYELASFLASPESEAFATQIAAEWRKSEEFRTLAKGRPGDEAKFGERTVSAFRAWLCRRVRETRSAG